LRGDIPPMVNTPEMRFQVDESRKFAVIDEVKERLAGPGASADIKVDATDGVRVSTPDGWWLLRASNTQDVLVARAESSDQGGLDRLMAQIDAQLAASGLARGPQADRRNQKRPLPRRRGPIAAPIEDSGWRGIRAILGHGVLGVR
jgi:phosphomannomutase